MARRRRSSKKEVSLFPFLDILGCLIGSLILIITTVVLDQMDTAPVAEAARIDDMKQEATREETRRARLEKRLADLSKQSGPAEQRLVAARARSQDASRKESEARRRLAAAEKLAVDAPKPPPPADTSGLASKRKQLDAEAAKFRAQIVERKKQPQQSIVILPPGGGGGPKRGVFIEAAKTGAIVHDGAKPWEVPSAKLAGDPQLKKLLEKIASDKDAIVTILVRPDGLGTYWNLQKAADAAKARTGRVPLPGDGKLDFTEAR
ncbi:MAG: hypothetical protein WCJ18_10975 [Planctomycetota bacterium]